MSIYRTRNGDINLNSIKNSISEILPNKSAEGLERVKFEQSQNASLVKAINNIETPVKEKHVRNIILGTCYLKSGLPFWYNSIKLQLYGNAIVCWKFGYVLHKILREGHSSCVDDSFRFVETLNDLSKSWVHLKQGYGTMLFHYCNFLAFKIKFHKKNQFIPCNLMIEDKDLIDIASNDINNYFQLCCEFFDYADEIIALQNAVFVTMDRSRSNSMTEAGQCKLSPLVLCIQESNQLYDFCVKFLFKLHDNLPSEILEGHRSRFLNMFKQLTKFYECCKNLQYFKNLISIPDMPNIPPNFRQISEFSNYSKPVMSVIEQPLQINDSIAEDDSILVDFSDLNQQSQLNSSSSSSNNNDSNSIQLQQIQQQQNAYIQQLLQEIERLRTELEKLSLESEFEIRNLRDKIKKLEDELILTNSELEQQRIKNSCIEEKLKIMNENEKAKADLDNLERKAISSEEKFNKMKELYTKLKDQHVILLRQEADVRKQHLSLNEACQHATKMKQELEKRLEEAINEKSKSESMLQTKANELQLLKTESEKNQADQMSSNQKTQEQLKNMQDQSKKLESELAETRKEIEKLEASKKDLQEKCTSLILNSTSLESELNKSKLNINELNAKLEELLSQKELSEKQLNQNQIKLRQNLYYGTIDQSILAIKESLNLFDDPILFNCKSGAEYLLTRLQPFKDYFSELLNNHDKLIVKNLIENNNDENNEKFFQTLKNINLFSNLVNDCVINGKITSLTAADLEQGEVLADLCRNFGQTSISFFEKIKSNKKCDLSNQDETKQIDEFLIRITKTLNDLLPKVHDINKQEIGDLIDQEMQNTTEAIESAVAKLELLINKSREQDTGVKLEVNDKILDACTALMKAIKILIIKAKELQKEIVAQGRGTSSVKEFYAKNHKWTEGLVSAAKLVGLGANVLIEKADKLVNGDGKLEEIIVCSNEIAASTAQLVVASNVKANRESQNRIALIDAKNKVSTATADLVASAKSCSQIIDDQTSMDFTSLSLHQTKRLEMEAQVKVLELEKQLENEKNKLYKLRKQHYQLAGEN